MANQTNTAGRWLAHQWRVWTWGAQVMVAAALWLGLSALTGGMVAAVIGELLGWDDSPALWFICAAVVAPFLIGIFTEMFESIQRRTPQP